jgi:hypothetical protein
MWRSRVCALGVSAAAIHRTAVSPSVRCSDGDDAGFPTSAWAAGAAVTAGCVAAAFWYTTGNSETANQKEWQSRWAGYKEAGIVPGFHKSVINPRLEEHYSTLFGDKKVRSHLTSCCAQCKLNAVIGRCAVACWYPWQARSVEQRPALLSDPLFLTDEGFGIFSKSWSSCAGCGDRAAGSGRVRC